MIPGCLNVTRRRRFIRSVWPFVVVWYGVMLACLVLTKVGRGIVDYVVSFCVPSWTGHVVDRILRNDDYRARRLLREHAQRQRRRRRRRHPRDEGGGGGGAAGTNHPPPPALPQIFAATTTTTVGENRRPCSLALKTRIYCKEVVVAAEKTDDGSDVGESTCTICFGLIQEGDRIGDLKCNHIFHVECLKTWLARRNQCPLCAGDAAVEQFDRCHNTNNDNDPPPDEQEEEDRVLT